MIRNELVTRKNQLERYIPQEIRFDNKIREVRDEFKFPNGDVYTGEWDTKENRMDGRGELFLAQEDALYEG